MILVMGSASPVHACVEDRHRSREFISFLKDLDAGYPGDTTIKIILDNHTSHVSKETIKGRTPLSAV